MELIMADQSQNPDLAFLIKIGQVKPEAKPTPAAKKDEE
jgi:hypothetical protein